MNLHSQKGIHKISKYLPRLGLSALMLCLASGLVLTFYYRPVGNVFQNVEEITTLVPYGWFFRQLHYAAGQLFVIFMLLHTADHFLRRRYRAYSIKDWTFLILSLCICFYTLFTGFILKGDKEGLFAGQIFMNILKGIPVAGESVSRVFISSGGDFFFLPYLYHCFLLPPLILLLAGSHIREWLPDSRFLLLTAFGLVLYALHVPPHVDIPPDAIVDLVRGPWFFLGIQTLLRIMDPLWAGLIMPGLFVGFLLLLPLAGKWGGWVIHYIVMAALCLYGLLSIWAALWGP